MSNLAHEFILEIELELANLWTQAKAHQADYQSDVIAACKIGRIEFSGVLPRVRRAKSFGFYIYWEKYEVCRGRVVKNTASSGRIIRISETIRQRRTGAPYPIGVFRNCALSGPELEVVMRYESRFEPIRDEVFRWVGILRELHKI